MRRPLLLNWLLQVHDWSVGDVTDHGLGKTCHASYFGSLDTSRFGPCYAHREA